MRLKYLLTNCLVAGSMLNAAAQTPCENGFAGDYPCSNIDMLSNVSAAELGAVEHNGMWVNDIWGWTDPQTGHEYALVGMVNGTSFVDVTDPLNPVVIGMLPEHHSTSGARMGEAPRAATPMHEFGKSWWRDIKVYKNHAFIVADADGNHGMQVFDLTQLRNTTNLPVTFSETAHYNGITSAHNIAINEETGFAYVTGANDGNHTCAVGGLHIVDISTPTNPVYAGCYDDDGYTHDAQIVTYNGPDADYTGKEIAFNSNEDALTIADVTDKNNIYMVSSKTYTNAQYVHQGWLTPDHKYFITNDELDEYYGRVNKTRTYIWNIEDLDNPVLVGFYEAPYNVIDHNLYTLDNFVFESNYTVGLRILAADNLGEGEMNEVAYFDTYPSDNSVQFEGNWSNYPYFASGNIIISDISRGLFVLKANLPKSISISGSKSVCAGSTASFSTNSNLEGNWQWQVDKNDGSGFTDLEASDIYAGINTSALKVTSNTELNNYRFRLKNTYNNEVLYSPVSSLLITPASEADFEYALKNGNYTFNPTGNSNESTSFYWSFGDGTTSTEQSPTHKFAEAGTYQVTLEVADKCGSNSSVVSVVVDENALGFEDEFQKDLQVFPNPSAGAITISSKEKFNLLEEVYVYDASGKVVYTRSFSLPVSEHKLELNGVQSGYYLVRIVTDNTTLVRPVILK